MHKIYWHCSNNILNILALLQNIKNMRVIVVYTAIYILYKLITFLLASEKSGFEPPGVKHNI
jgi:hypothetical protein